MKTDNGNGGTPSASAKGTTSPSSGPPQKNDDVIDVDTDPLPSGPSLKLSVNPPKPYRGDLNECEHFLRKMKRYLKVCRVHPSRQAKFAATYLEGSPDKL